MIEEISPATPIQQAHANALVPFDQLKREISRVIVGNQEAIEFILAAILCNGHVLVEGVPGIAKTTMIKTTAQALGLSFKRIQFTPDLLPSDLIGTLIFNQKINDFETKPGPIFANVILADEINRAPAKVQSALLESMQEQQVTIGSTTFNLDKPYLVFATQNPLEQQGTYQLPEAQIDRFMFKLHITYPSMEEEHQVIKRAYKNIAIQPVLKKEDIFQAQRVVEQTYVDQKVVDYIIHLVFATRQPELFNAHTIKPYIKHGASPRATLSLYHAAQAIAFLEGRQFVTPDDVKKVALPILRHRLLLTFLAQGEELSCDTLISEIIKMVPAP